MRSITAAKPATTPIPVQLSETEFTACILPHLSMPKRGPKCKLGYHRVFNLILWLLYLQSLARWAEDGSLWQAFGASVQHLAAAQHLDMRVLHGDGTNTIAQKGGMASGTRGTNTKRGRKSSR